MQNNLLDIPPHNIWTGCCLILCHPHFLHCSYIHPCCYDKGRMVFSLFILCNIMVVMYYTILYPGPIRPGTVYLFGTTMLLSIRHSSNICTSMMIGITTFTSQTSLSMEGGWVGGSRMGGWGCVGEGKWVRVGGWGCVGEYGWVGWVEVGWVMVSGWGWVGVGWVGDDGWVKDGWVWVGWVGEVGGWVRVNGWG